MAVVSLAARIVEALERGPLYEGALPLIVGGTMRDVIASLSALRREGVVERVPADPMTWRLR